MTVVAYSWWDRIIPIPTDICHWSDHCTLWAFLPPLYLPVWKQTWWRKARPPFFLRLDWQDVKFDMILRSRPADFFASCQSSPVQSSLPVQRSVPWMQNVVLWYFFYARAGTRIISYHIIINLRSHHQLSPSHPTIWLIFLLLPC